MKCALIAIAVVLGSTGAIENELFGIKPGSSVTEVIDIFGAPSTDAANVEVGATNDLRLLAFDDHQVSVFLRADRVVFIALVNQEVDGFPPTIAELVKAAGPAGQVLPSAHGRDAKLHLFPTLGIAAHARDGSISVIELFEPITAKQYEQRFYRRPTAH